MDNLCILQLFAHIHLAGEGDPRTAGPAPLAAREAARRLGANLLETIYLSHKCGFIGFTV